MNNKTQNQHNPPHPGAFIRSVYMVPNKLGVVAVATKLRINPSTFSRLLNQKSSVSPKMAVKLSKVLGRTPQSWMQMQNNFDIYQAQKMLDLRKYRPMLAWGLGQGKQVR